MKKDALFSDGTQIKYTDTDGNLKVFESAFIQNYIKNARRTSNAKNWKTDGYGAQFRGETEVARQANETIDAFINSVGLVGEDKILYSFSVNNMSGLIQKSLSSLPTDPEEHLIHSNELEFSGAEYNESAKNILFTLKDNTVTSSIAVFDILTSDYHKLTDGDAADENASCSKTEPGKIYFNSRGVGRDVNGNFTEYGDSSIQKLDLNTLELTEVLAEPGCSFVKPKEDGSGNLYCIKRGGKQRKRGFFGVLLDILLIPAKIFLAIYLFIESFVLLFTGKTFTSKDANPTKGRKANSQKIFVEGNLIHADREFKRNQRKKDKDAGFIPLSWQLVKIAPDKTQTVIKHGICDYHIERDNEILAVNGKSVFLINADGCTKLSSGQNVVRVGGQSPVIPKNNTPFDF